MLWAYTENISKPEKTEVRSKTRMVFCLKNESVAELIWS